MREKLISSMKGIFGQDTRRINHALKVLRFSEDILSGENLTEELCEIVISAAVLHDIGIHEAERKYNSNAGKYQEIEGPPIARKILEGLGIKEKAIERICYIIGGHHTQQKVDGVDFQIIWEADLLVNIEEEGQDKKGFDLNPIIEKNFKTKTGKAIAEKLYKN